MLMRKYYVVLFSTVFIRLIVLSQTVIKFALSSLVKLSFGMDMTKGYIPTYAGTEIRVPGLADVGSVSMRSDRTWDGVNGVLNFCNRYGLVHGREFTGSIYQECFSPYNGLDTWFGTALYPVQAEPPRESPFSDQLIIKCLHTLAENAKGDAFDASMAYAEMDKTIGSIASTAHKLAGYFSALRKGNFKGALAATGKVRNRSVGRYSKKSPRTTFSEAVNGVSAPIANAHLEMTYAWAPLMADVKAAAESYAAATHFSRSTRVTAIASSRYKWKNGVTSSGLTNHSIKMWSDVTLMFQNPMDFLAVDPLQVAWERVPFSFVFDWFVPIGSLISAFNDLTIIGGQIGVSEKKLLSSQKFPNPQFDRGDGVLYRETMFGEAKRSDYTFNRYHLDQSLMGIVNSFQANNKPSLQHALNGLALIAGSRPSHY